MNGNIDTSANTGSGLNEREQNINISLDNLNTSLDPLVQHTNAEIALREIRNDAVHSVEGIFNKRNDNDFDLKKQSMSQDVLLKPFDSQVNIAKPNMTIKTIKTNNDSVLKEKIMTPYYTNGPKISNTVGSTDLRDCLYTMNIPPGYYDKKRKDTEEAAILRKKYRNKYKYLKASYIIQQQQPHSSYYKVRPVTKMIVHTHKRWNEKKKCFEKV